MAARKAKATKPKDEKPEEETAKPEDDAKAKDAPKHASADDVMMFVLKGAILGYLEEKGSYDGSMAVSIDADDLPIVGLDAEQSLADFMLVQAGYMKWRNGEWDSTTPMVHKAISDFFASR